VDDIGFLRRTYQEALDKRTGRRFVSTVVNDHFSCLCPTIVLDDADEAFRIGARGQRFFAQAINQWYSGGPPPDEDIDEHEDVLAATERARETMIARLHEAQVPVNPRSVQTLNVDHAYGAASRAIDYVEALQSCGVDEVMCLMQMGTVPQAACLETIRQWGTKVIPYFRR
ncbi:MAG: LLM class flavin-dependent oxidoreductase, partial [Chloroflexi bacterium]|nr:LLM class flavin-dependent oxidoreductase [Chloroflexota bacterium]